MRQVKILGALREDQLPAFARAKSMLGSKKVFGTEFIAECYIKYGAMDIRVIPVAASLMVQMSMPNPIPYRSVSVGSKSRGDVQITTSNAGNYGSPVEDGWWMNYHYDVWYTATIGGVQVATAYEWSEYWVFGGGGSSNPNFTTGSDGSSLAALYAAVAAALGTTTYGAQTQVRSSDGTILNSVVSAFIGNPANAHYDTYISNTPLSFSWPGGSWIPLFDLHDSGYDGQPAITDAGLLTFTVPEDCFSTTLSITPPAYPVGADPHPSWWDAMWLDAYNQNKERREAWLRKNTTTLLELLRAGTTPADWDMALKRAAPQSNRVKRAHALVETITDAAPEYSSPSSGVNVTLTRRHVKLEYDYDEVQQDNSIVVKHKSIEFDGYKTVTTYTTNGVVRTGYSNWYISHITDAPFTWVSHASLEDSLIGSKKGLGLVWNGQAVSGAVHIADSRYHTTPAASFTADYNDSTDKFYSVDLTSTVNSFVAQYLIDVPIIALKTNEGASPLWCNSAFRVGTIAAAYLYGAVKDGVEHGCFLDEWPAHSKTRVYGVATFILSSSGNFELAGWHEPSKMRIIDENPGEEGGNALVFFGVTYQDLVNRAIKQRGSLSAFHRAVMAASA